MKEKRIFTFGCSFTNGLWPTWANILLYGNNGVNFGIAGGGMEQILHRIVECDRKYNITKDDIVIVMLTTPIRWDLLLNNDGKLKWKCLGQATTSDNLKYENSLFSVEGLIYKSLNNILLINDYLKNRDLNYHLTSINDVYNDFGDYFEDYPISDNLIELSNYVKTNVHLDFENVHTFLYGNKKGWQTNAIWTDVGHDFHPTTLQNYKWMMSNLPKEIINLVKVTEEDINDIENTISNLNTTIKEGSLLFVKKYPEYYMNNLNETCYLNDLV